MTDNVIQFPNLRKPLRSDEFTVQNVVAHTKEHAAMNWNKVMHLRAHGWHVATILGNSEGYRCVHKDVDSVGSLSLDDAWQAQRLMELSRRRS